MEIDVDRFFRHAHSLLALHCPCASQGGRFGVGARNSWNGLFSMLILTIRAVTRAAFCCSLLTVSCASREAPSAVSESSVRPGSRHNDAYRRLDVGGRDLPFYSNFDFAGRDIDVERAIVVVHGTLRNADEYFDSMLKLVAQSGAENVLVIAPHFQTNAGLACSHVTDEPARNDLAWSCDDWKAGRDATGTQLSSFEALDTLVEAASEAFPALSRVVVAGHSAGGQFVQRYSLASTVGDNVRFIVANPSSYMYLDDIRPTNASTCTPEGCPDGFGPFAGAAECPSFNQYKYGTRAMPPALDGLSAEELAERLRERRPIYLLGALDSSEELVAGFNELDRSCAAEAQGPFRLQRGLAYFNYARRYGARPSDLHVVSECGHNQACMFGSIEGRKALNLALAD